MSYGFCLKKLIGVTTILTGLLILSLFDVMDAETLENETWSENIKLTYEALNPIYGSSLVAEDSNIYVAWADERYTNPSNGYNDFEIFFKKSMDGGKTWTEDIRLTNNSDQHTVDYWCNDFAPEIAVKNNTVYIVWHRDLGGISTGKHHHYEIFYIRSNDCGQTWTDEVQLTYTPNETIGSCSADIATSGNTTHVVYVGGDYKIYYMKSIDMGETWSQPTPLSDRMAGFPSIAYSNGSLHLIYTGPTDYIYYKKSENNGEYWSENKLLGQSGYQGRIAVENNYVHVVYYDDRGGDMHAYYARSIDGGENWYQEIRLVDFPSVDPDVSVNNGTVHVVWCDYRAQNKEIYYKRSTDNGGQWDDDMRLTYDPDDSSYPRVATQGTDCYVIWSSYNFTENWTYIYFKRSFTKNLSKPIVTVTSPKDGERIKWVAEGTFVWINGTAYSTNPNTTILKVEIKIGIRDWEIVNGTTNWSYLWDLTQLTQADWAATNYTGNFTIFARAWDGCTYSECYMLTVHHVTPGQIYFEPLDVIRICGPPLAILCLIAIALYMLRRFRK
ncbi:MAG: sialidase family protein [Candidatus Thermoplasmatota archaeon]|nr:sialidase family protein [Candidatus Thermoplasmatota archaeon]